MSSEFAPFDMYRYSWAKCRAPVYSRFPRYIIRRRGREGSSVVSTSLADKGGMGVYGHLLTVSSIKWQEPWWTLTRCMVYGRCHLVCYCFQFNTTVSRSSEIFMIINWVLDKWDYINKYACIHTCVDALALCGSGSCCGYSVLGTVLWTLHGISLL